VDVVHPRPDVTSASRRTQLPEELFAHTEVRGRVSPEGEETGDTGVEELTDDAGLVHEGGSHTREMRHWVHTAGKKFAQDLQRRRPR